MSSFSDPSLPSDLTVCDREPIHLLGGIQPFGFLLCVNEGWNVTRASENMPLFLDVRHEHLMGQPLTAFLSPELVHDIRGRLQLAGGLGVVERLFGRRLVPGGTPFDIAMHQSGPDTVLEFEPASEQANNAPSILRNIFARIEQWRTHKDMFREVARQVRALTGFDRVMVYRFDDSGAGEVVAESAIASLPPFLGLRYPASDIPAQARTLYARNILRIIADVDAPPIPVTPVLSLEGTPLDLSMSVLRGVSAIHLEYLRNMGVRASLSISILREGGLWGLIACHHDMPRHLTLHTRSMAELFGQMFSYLLESRQHQDDAAYDSQARDIHHKIVSAFVAPDTSPDKITEALRGAADYIAADGVGICRSGQVTLMGLTPTREEFSGIAGFLTRTEPGRIFSTHCLKDVFPPALDYVMRAAGLLAIPISRTPRDYVVFFRREVTKTVTWAGEPVKTGTLGPNGVRLTPRKSFEAWQETVRHQSEPWTRRELRVAEMLRVNLVEVILHLSEGAEAERLRAQRHQEILIAELNHRVRNILGLVRGLVTQSGAKASDVRSLVRSLGDRIGALARAHDVLSGTEWKPGSLHALLRAEIAAYDETEQRLVLRGPDVLLQPRALSAMALLVHEAMTNARKHGALVAPGGRIIIETAPGSAGAVTLSWREVGGPPVTPPTRRGFGTAILEQIIPFEVDGTSTPRFLMSGLVLDVVLPAAAASCAPEDSPALARAGEEGKHPEGAMAAAATIADLLTTCLVLEDNMFVALDVEDMLRQLGAGTVDIAKSVAEAFALLAERRHGFAMLDINLGPENSFPVAQALRDRGIPFVFGTGYGEVHGLDKTLADVPVITKPYHPERLMGVLTRLIAPAHPDDAAS